MLDSLICEIDAALRTLFPPAPRISLRPSPGSKHEDSPLSLKEKKQVAGLMRVNHSGEVCAQALYRGQALGAKEGHIQTQMQKAAAEEIDHLAWCEARLAELNANTSWLNPIWYGCSLFLGLVAGFAGDNKSLGFVAETEHQVSRHLQEHLDKLPFQDQKTKAIIEQMHQDEAYHAQLAHSAGAEELPFIIKLFMAKVAKIMTVSSYYI